MTMKLFPLRRIFYLALLLPPLSAAAFPVSSGAATAPSSTCGRNPERINSTAACENSTATLRLTRATFFATNNPPLVFDQFGGNMGGPILKDRTFFFGSYEGTRNAAGQVASFQVETPQLRDYVNRTAPNSIANRLLTQYGSPATQKVGACAVASNNCLNIGGGQLIANSQRAFLLAPGITRA